MSRFLNWLDHRTGYRTVMHAALYEHIPGGARWRYVWGSTLVFAFATQVVTGLLLWMAYSPSSQTAWADHARAWMAGWLPVLRDCSSADRAQASSKCSCAADGMPSVRAEPAATSTATSA